MSKPAKTEAELIAMARAELKVHADCPDGIVISVLRDGDSWEFRASAEQATIDRPGYPECVAMLVQIGDHLSKQYDLRGRSAVTALILWAPCAISGAQPRHKTASLVEAMHARIGAAALHQDLMAIPLPRLGKGCRDHRAAVTATLKIRMGGDVFENAVQTPAAQQIGRRDQHAG